MPKILLIDRDISQGNSIAAAIRKSPLEVAVVHSVEEAAAIVRLLRDPDLARRLGRGGRVLMSAEFSIPAMVEGNLAVYRELLRRHD